MRATVLASATVYRLPVGNEPPVLTFFTNDRVPVFDPQATNFLIYDRERIEYIHGPLWFQTVLPGYEMLVAPEIVWGEM